jgi:hypothetical protein
MPVFPSRVTLGNGNQSFSIFTAGPPTVAPAACCPGLRGRAVFIVEHAAKVATIAIKVANSILVRARPSESISRDKNVFAPDIKCPESDTQPAWLSRHVPLSQRATFRHQAKKEPKLLTEEYFLPTNRDEVNRFKKGR